MLLVKLKSYITLEHHLSLVRMQWMKDNLLTVILLHILLIALLLIHIKQLSF